MTAPPPSSPLTTGRLVCAVTALLTVAALALLRVPTYLGVKVEEANRQAGVGQTVLDKRGDEYLWRVWWRARGDFVVVDPSWLLGAALLLGLAVFVVGIFAAYRIALSIPVTPPPRDV